MPEGSSEKFVRFGPRYISDVPLGSLNELTQVRQSYDSVALDELATSMIVETEDGMDGPVTSDAFNLNNPLIVARLDRFAAHRYLIDHAEHYDVPADEASTLQELEWQEDGTAHVLIAGHRRKRAIHQLADRFELDPNEMTVAATVHDNISFAEALGLQLRENVYEKPPVHDEAKAIDRFYRDVIRHEGKAPSIPQFAARLGFSDTKVRDALAFASLPVRIQEFTASGLLSYSTVRRLKPLADAYAKLYMNRSEAEAREMIENDLVVTCQDMLRMELNRNTEKSRARLIENKCKEIWGQADYQQEALFLFEPSLPERRRQTSTRHLAKLAVSVVEDQVRHHELDIDTLTDLRAKLDDAIELAMSRTNQAFDIFA